MDLSRLPFSIDFYPFRVIQVEYVSSSPEYVCTELGPTPCMAGNQGPNSALVSSQKEKKKDSASKTAIYRLGPYVDV
jgi:hypothetical protein